MKERTNVIEKTYLPFTADELRPHFVVDVEGQLAYYQRSAKRYRDFMDAHQETAGISLKQSMLPRQIEKDERFWTVTAFKHVFDDPSCDVLFGKLLNKTYGPTPPIPGMSSWGECLRGELRLYFEACLPSPPEYVDQLHSDFERRQMIPYVLDAARRKGARRLEGATHVDAMLINLSNRFAWLIEAKVLSDVSYSISFDIFRNQISRNIDVMLDNTSKPGAGLERRDPKKSLFALLTPEAFKKYPSSRLYGWLMSEYKKDPDALKRDLGHRSGVDWNRLSRRIGWFTFEDLEEVKPGACPWLSDKTH
jgi:hypothetical protein